ncbi:hypothetical protein ACWKT5_01800 [Streptomyces avermitilis]
MEGNEGKPVRGAEADAEAWQRLSAYSYLSAPERLEYVAVMRVFCGTLLADLSVPDLLAKLAEKGGPGAALDAETLTRRLEEPGAAAMAAISRRPRSTADLGYRWRRLPFLRVDLREALDRACTSSPASDRGRVQAAFVAFRSTVVPGGGPSRGRGPAFLRVKGCLLWTPSGLLLTIY